MIGGLFIGIGIGELIFGRQMELAIMLGIVLLMISKSLVDFGYDIYKKGTKKEYQNTID